jgi:hypothetical protein
MVAQSLPLHMRKMHPDRVPTERTVATLWKVDHSTTLKPYFYCELCLLNGLKCAHLTGELHERCGTAVSTSTNGGPSPLGESTMSTQRDRGRGGLSMVPTAARTSAGLPGPIPTFSRDQLLSLASGGWDRDVAVYTYFRAMRTLDDLYIRSKELSRSEHDWKRSDVCLSHFLGGSANLAAALVDLNRLVLESLYNAYFTAVLTLTPRYSHNTREEQWSAITSTATRLSRISTDNTLRTRLIAHAQNDILMRLVAAVSTTNPMLIQAAAAFMVAVPIVSSGKWPHSCNAIASAITSLIDGIRSQLHDVLKAIAFDVALENEALADVVQHNRIPQASSQMQMYIAPSAAAEELEHESGQILHLRIVASPSLALSLQPQTIAGVPSQAAEAYLLPLVLPMMKEGGGLDFNYSNGHPLQFDGFPVQVPSPVAQRNQMEPVLMQQLLQLSGGPPVDGIHGDTKLADSADDSSSGPIEVVASDQPQHDGDSNAHVSVEPCAVTGQTAPQHRRRRPPPPRSAGDDDDGGTEETIPLGKRARRAPSRLTEGAPGTAAWTLV